MPICIVDHQGRARTTPPVDSGLELLDKVMLDETLRDEGDRRPAEPHIFGDFGSGRFVQTSLDAREDILAVYKFQIVVLHPLHTNPCPLQTQAKVRYCLFSMGFKGVSLPSKMICHLG